MQVSSEFIVNVMKTFFKKDTDLLDVKELTNVCIQNSLLKKRFE